MRIMLFRTFFLNRKISQIPKNNIDILLHLYYNRFQFKKGSVFDETKLACNHTKRNHITSIQ